MQPTPAVDTLITPLFKKTRKRPAQYIIDIDLLDAPLSIHRRLSIPSNMNLGYVQEILMLAMGWQGHHLKEITYGNVTYTTRYAGGQNPEPMDDFPQKDSYKHTLGDLLKTEEDSLLFKYDLGDGWTHRVTLSEIRPYSDIAIQSENYWAELISGEGACPPDDVGGTSGYAELLRTINNPTDVAFEDTLKWIGPDFDPYYFDHRLTHARINDFQRTIGEARWGFYRK
ncbi:MAG: plasmid pRiA4b ORF-3 family protein [Bacteroidaceae bacterium]|nr:plasmid pRiA4b ORF-3 family protein [Bacteroidaceae bacterium]